MQDLDTDEHMQLLVKLLKSTGTASPEKPIQWRFSIMANSLLLMLTPIRSAHAARQMADHFFPLLLHQQLPQRSLAAIFFIYTLNRGPTWATVSPYSYEEV